MGLIQRIGSPGSFKYVYMHGRKSGTMVTDEDILMHIQKLRIPPAYTGVVISDKPRDKIQAYGYDAKGRKQTLYAQWFIERQRRKKFARVMAMEETIQAIEKDVTHTLRTAKVVTTKVEICMIVRLIMLCNFRIGSDANVKKNKSYGLTTLEWKHLKVTRRGIEISFIGKKGVLNEGRCEDKDILRLVKLMRETAEDVRVFRVHASDVNAYLKSFNDDISSKDIRTWQANALFIKYFIANEENESKLRKRQQNAIERVAKDLHHTVAVCKGSYLHPEFLS